MIDFKKEGFMPTALDRDGVKKQLEAGAQLIDVLPAGEYRDEHIVGAINIPVKILSQDSTQVLDRDMPVVVYCHDYQ